jgi:SAP domain-containing ribonucleoprotein
LREIGSIDASKVAICPCVDAGAAEEGASQLRPCHPLPTFLPPVSLPYLDHVADFRNPTTAHTGRLYTQSPELGTMEAKLQSLKVAELKALLTSAGLAVSGNKPDLIQRLLENPAATASLGGEAQEAAAAAEPAAAPEAVVEAASEPSPAPPAAAPASVSEAKAASPAASAAAVQASESEQRDALIRELEKRKARAAKFGQPLGEAERKLERAIKFGLAASDEADVAKLSQPLGAGAPTPKREGNKQNKAAQPAQRVESEEDKQQRLAALEAEKEKARKRAERFGLVPKESGEDADKKRKRDARFNNPDPTAEDKKLKT